MTTTESGDARERTGPGLVVVLPAWYPVPWNPGQGTFFREQAAAMAASGVHVCVAFPELRSLRTIPGGRGLLRQRCQTEWSREGSLPTVRWHGWNLPVRRLRPGLFRHGALTALRAVEARYGRPSLVHVQGLLRTSAAARAVVREMGLPVVVTAHESDFLTRELRSDERAAVRRAVRSARRATAVSPALAERLSEIAGAPVDVLPDFVDGTYFCAPPTPRSGHAYTVVTVAGLKPVKGVDVLVRGFAEAFAGRPGVRLIVAGEGPEREALEALVVRLGVAGQVRFNGHLQRSAVRRLLWESDLFALASRAETFGVALVEAMATGLPAVATDCGGPSTIVTEDTGVLVPPDDVPALAGALRAMWGARDRWRDQAASIRDSVLVRFGAEAVVPRVHELYRDAAEGTHDG